MMLVERVEVRGFRNLADRSLSLDPSLTVLLGSNGAGKTNLLEAVYFGLTGRSCRTSNEREAIRFDETLARVEATVTELGETRTFLSAVTRADGRRQLVDGDPAGPEAARLRPPVAVFMPDRLALVKGPPAARRAHLDRLVPALWPARAGLRARYGRALAQRNALLARARGSAAPASLDAWDVELASEAAQLIAARREAVELLRDPFAGAARRLGLPGEATIEYRPRSEAADPESFLAELRARRKADLERGRTSHGPHLDELAIRLAGSSLRSYGSQGQQRTALLALLFAERETLVAHRGTLPLMLLDDVMSELDPERRELLVETILTGGQTLLTATHSEQLPACSRRELAVRGGRIEVAAAGDQGREAA